MMDWNGFSSFHEETLWRPGHPAIGSFALNLDASWWSGEANVKEISCQRVSKGGSQLWEGMLCRSGFRPARLLRPCIVGLASPDCQLQTNEARMHTLYTGVDQSRRGKTRLKDGFRRGFGLLILTCPEA